MHNQSVITLHTSEGHVFFQPEEIVRLEASSNYTRIFLRNNTKIISAKVLKQFAAMLEPMGFVRTHRAHLVNKQHILCITPEGKLIMRDASVATISKRMKGGVMKVLKNVA